MSPTECMRVLELGESASIEQIKRGYRRLAQQYHPDKHGGNLELARHFTIVSQAYRSLMRVARGVAAGKMVGRCTVCGEFDEVAHGRDGRLYCRRCIFRPAAGRLLPMPPLTVAKCLGTLCLFGAAAYLLILSLAAGPTAPGAALAAAAFVVGLVGLAWLAWTAVAVGYCLSARERLLIESCQSAGQPERVHCDL